jgi:sigma-B regulation protein RsbU (phosphoserine phosphatase)
LKKNGASKLLSGEGIALGIIEDVKYAEKTIRLQKGDTVVFYTDGVTEAVNEDFDEFGLERLIQVVRATHDDNTESIINSITEAIADHAGNTPQFDDITLIVMKI